MDTAPKRIDMRIRCWMMPPVFPKHEVKTRTAANLFLLFQVTIIGALLYSAVLLIVVPDRAVATFAVIVIPVIGFVLLAKRGHVLESARLYVVFVWSILMLSSLDSGGIRAIGYSAGGFLSLLLAGLLLQRKHIFTFIVLTALYGLLLIWMEQNGALPNVRDNLSPVTTLVTIVVFLLGTATVSYITLRSVNKSLDDAHQRLAEREKAEAALRESERRYRALTANLPNSAIILYDPGLTFLLVDGPEVEATGYSSTMMVGKQLYQAVPEDFARLAEPNMRAVLEGKRFTAELPFRDQIHSYHYLPLEDDEGTIRYGMILAQNITERKRLEAELREYATHLESLVEERTAAMRRAKDQLELILNTTTDALAFAQPNGSLETTNPAFLSMFTGCNPETIHSILDCFADDEQIKTIQNALQQVIDHGQPQRLQAQIAHPESQPRDLDLSLIPVPTGGNEKNGVLLSAHDITHLKEIERFKARFVADALHDMATPISGLKTRLYLLQRSPEKLPDHIRALENQTQHLQHLLEDLRTLSGLDRGQIRLELESCDINAIVRRVFDTYEPVALDKRQSFGLSANPLLPPLLLDPRQMERALVNLVSNAVNYTPAGRGISLSTQRDANHIVICIADEGIGISSEDQSRIFDRFFRSEQARRLVAGGTGLGLAITQYIIQLHNGSISVVSQADSGSTFTVRLPIQTDNPQA
jgi:PAS domain S-box-containing protein